MLHRGGDELNRSDEAVADLADGLDDVRRSGIIFEDAPEFGDAADESIVANIGVRPDGMNEFFLSENFAVAGN